MEAIRVVGMPSIWGLPSPSPFCLKLETWLRMEKIPYTCVALNSMPQSKTGKVPYILRNDGSTLADSNIIIATLANEHGIDLTYGVSSEEQARAHLILRTLEESLYFAGAWERWMHPESWPITRAGYFGALPAGIRNLIAGLVRRKMRTLLHGQGVARHEPAQILALAAQDVKALAMLLGEQPFFHGERPGVADASAYGLFANALGFPGQSEIRNLLHRHPKLVEFCERMKRLYWRDDSSSEDIALVEQERDKKIA
ncbi:glutathione S-transferase [Paucimonas lemoignei]|uniref:Glutathione S-transferase n=1 Tax=Paucimonas lemoignei TaxID=29443 RepID=A0A4R3HQU9_PAULE|nr:glutathione S-transferase family protein [Paucimonas lemoignei]TCS35145.1 glutathione S-transferase [Paucimonas lemoignei]